MPTHLQTAFTEVRRRAARDGWRGRIRAWQRWTGTPFAAASECVPSHGLVVDLGCGFGMLAALLALECPARRLVGLDIDTAKIARAQRLFGDLARFEVLDLAGDSGPALPDATADAVVLWDVLHHLADPAGTIRLAARWLRPGGVLVVKENDVEPTLKRWVAEAVEVVAVGLDVTASAPVQFRTRAEWASMLESAGLIVTRNEHLHAREGFFVPHALLIARRPTEL